MVTTLYQEIDDELFERIGQIRLVLSDVDGVLSDGKIYLTETGDEIKSFNAKDGAGIVALRSCNVSFGVITGRSSKIVQRRMSALGASFIIQGVKDKLAQLHSIIQEMGISAQQCLYVGDDVIDLPLMRAVGVGVTVHDAHPLVIREADLVTVNIGGNGAIREVTDTILQYHGKLDQKEISQ